jgi:hypothetical protein
MDALQFQLGSLVKVLCESINLDPVDGSEWQSKYPHEECEEKEVRVGNPYLILIVKEPIL